MNARFWLRLIRFIVHSKDNAWLRLIPLSIVTYPRSLTGRRPRVYLAPFPFWWVASRAGTSLVAPVYRVPSAHSRTYTYHWVIGRGSGRDSSPRIRWATDCARALLHHRQHQTRMGPTDSCLCSTSPHHLTSPHNLTSILYRLAGTHQPEGSRKYHNRRSRFLVVGPSTVHSYQYSVEQRNPRPLDAAHSAQVFFSAPM